MARTFTRKGYGRIYVDNDDNIDKVKEIIKQMDEFEFDYLPEKLITNINNYPEFEYCHKFDALDLDELTYRCYIAGIFIMCVDNGHSEFKV